MSATYTSATYMYIFSLQRRNDSSCTSSALEVHGWGHAAPPTPVVFHINLLHACHGHRAHSKINHRDINNTFSEQYWSCYFLG